MADPRLPEMPRRRQGLWLTVGEVVAVLALIVTGFNVWDSHREHSVEAKRADASARARSALVLSGQADAGGRKIVLAPVKPDQVISSQRYLFPPDVLDHAMEVTAARPQIDVDWIAGGLKRVLSQAGAKGAGEAQLPAGILTTYVEDGETRTDSSLYLIGFNWRSRWLGGREVSLQGVSLVQRHVGGDVQGSVNRRWARARAALVAQR